MDTEIVPRRDDCAPPQPRWRTALAVGVIFAWILIGLACGLTGGS